MHLWLRSSSQVCRQWDMVFHKVVYWVQAYFCYTHSIEQCTFTIFAYDTNSITMRSLERNQLINKTSEIMTNIQQWFFSNNLVLLTPRGTTERLLLKHHTVRSFWWREMRRLGFLDYALIVTRTGLHIYKI